MIERFALLNENAMVKTPTGKDVHVSCLEPGAEILACQLCKNILDKDRLDLVKYKSIIVNGIIQWKVHECLLVNHDLMVTPNQLVPTGMEIRRIESLHEFNRIIKAKLDENIELSYQKIEHEKFDNLDETFYGILTDYDECIFVNNILMFTNGMR